MSSARRAALTPPLPTHRCASSASTADSAMPTAQRFRADPAQHPAGGGRPRALRCRAAGASDVAALDRRGLMLGAAAAGSSVLANQGSALAGSLALVPGAGSAMTMGSSSIPRTALGAGVSVSQVIKGCWQLSGGHRGDRETDRTSGRAALDDCGTFYANGITSFDAADHYGPAEVLLGRWVSLASQATGADVRSRVQLLTKVCVFDGLGMAGVSGASMREAVDTSVKRLGTTPDVVQFYWGSYDIPRYVDAAKYLADEQGRGRFKLLGVTNFDVPRLEDIVDKGGVQLATNQLQYSLLDQRPDNGMVRFCLDHGIQLLPYGVLAGGLLSDKYLGQPASSVRLDTFSKRKYAGVVEAAGGWAWFQRLLSTLDGVASKHGSSISNVAARWVLDRPGVAAVILGARNANHVQDHVQLFSLALDDQDRAAIQDVLDAGARARGDCYQWERGIGPW